MKKPKKLLALLLAAVIMAGTLPMSALAVGEPSDAAGTPAPVESTLPTETPAPSESVNPTETPAPATSVEPTETPAPTEETPAPTTSVEPTETPAPTLDELRAELRDMLEEMTKDFFSGDFTADSWKEFQAKLEEAWALLNRGEEENSNETPATEEELQNAIATLSLAPNALMARAGELNVPTNPVYVPYAAPTGNEPIDPNSWFVIVDQASNGKYYALNQNPDYCVEVTVENGVVQLPAGVEKTDYLWRFVKVDNQYQIITYDGWYMWAENIEWTTTSNRAHTSQTEKSLDVSAQGYDFTISQYGSGFMWDRTLYLQYNNDGFYFSWNESSVNLYRAVEEKYQYGLNNDQLTIVLNQDPKEAALNSDIVINKYYDGTDIIAESILLNAEGVTLDTSDVNSSTVGTGTITVKYDNWQDTITVNVIDPTQDPSWGDQYPDYPNQGSVRVTKTATADKVASEGVSWVELGVTGVPKKNPVDVVLIIDTSGSMSSSNRIRDARNAAKEFVNILLEENADGTASENRVALVEYNSYADILVNLTSNKNELTGEIDDLRADGNTNYDDPMKKAAEILSGVREQEEGYSRQQFVVFMSDGSPCNGYNDVNVGGGDKDYDYFARMGAFQSTHKYSDAVKALPATIYTVGFSLSYSYGFEKEECQWILETQMASRVEGTDNEYYYYDAKDGDALTAAFNSIANNIRLAGTDAKVSDTIGEDFELRWETVDGSNPTVVYKVGDRTMETVTLSVAGNGVKSANSSWSGDLSVGADGSFAARYFSYNGTTQTFSWTIGDITSDEATLGYYVYLIGSHDSRDEPEAGPHDTNEVATLTYVNYQDQNCEKVFPVPTVPWTGALAHYEFYLVNDKGQPVNSNGQVVPFEERITIYHNYMLLEQNSDNTIDAGTIVANDVLPAGYALHIADAKYEVHPVTSGTGWCSITGTVPTGSEDSTILVSPEDPQNSMFQDSTVAFGVTNTMEMKDRTVVVDFGKPITAIELNEEDNILGGQIVGFMAGTPNFTQNTGHVYNNIPEGCVSTLAGTYGTFSVEDGKAVYTPTAIMNGTETVNVIVESVQREGQGSAGLATCYMWATLTVIPATNVYYEDTFFNGTDAVDNLVSSNEGNDDKVTEQDAYTQGDTYGYDSHYSGIKTDNSTMTVEDQNLPGTFTFTFKGTGVDIYSRTDNSSDMVVAQLYQNGEVLQQQLVYAVYETNGGVLYNVPTISFAGLDYDTYTVKLTVPASGLTDKTFYIDGVRVYDPAANDQNAQNAYAMDGEDRPWQVEVRDILLKAESLNKEDNTGNGAVYVDGESGVTEITTYDKVGPKNETYLENGNTIGFKLANGSYNKVLIGAKSADGKTVELVVNGKPVDTISTTTDMYYDITSCIDSDGVVTITTTGDGILSLTKLRMTGVTGTPAITVDKEVLEAAGIIPVEVTGADDFWTGVWNGIKELFSWPWKK